MNSKKTLFESVVVLYFIIAFEVLIMISPFAGFFYAVFNPFLLRLAAHPATRWLSAFYLPHMVLPSDTFLMTVRIAGSVLFVLGMVSFSICAAQIYFAKFTRKGAVLRGLYSIIRHPQYLALEVAGLGLAILWPRILTVVLWAVMCFIYFILAKDEERRMLASHRERYEPYLKKTGMFLPKVVESAVTPSSRAGKGVASFAFFTLVIGGAFLLRSYTIHHLTVWEGNGNVTAMAILPEDGMKMEHRMDDILATPEVKSHIQPDKQYLAYFMPRDYIMQGMIADTGGNWRLFERHRTIGMIADWVFNPFGHLRDGHHAMHGDMHGSMHGGEPAGANGADLTRRLIFLSVEKGKAPSLADLFSINALRVPQFMVDVDVHNARIEAVNDLPHGSGWGTVPTPLF